MHMGNMAESELHCVRVATTAMAKNIAISLAITLVRASWRAYPVAAVLWL